MGSDAVLVKRGDSVEVGNVNSIGQRADKPKITKIASEPISKNSTNALARSLHKKK